MQSLLTESTGSSATGAVNIEANSTTARQTTATAGYAMQLAQLSPSSSASTVDTQGLNLALNKIAAGLTVEAKAALHQNAETARGRDDAATAELAGLLWQVADRMEKTKQSLAEKNFSKAKTSASSAADLVRTLLGRGLDSAANQKIIATAGGFWTAANEAQNKLAESGAPIVDQHRLPHERNWAFCGIATMIMVLRQNGHDAPASSRADVAKLAQGIYYTGEGTSGAGMAARLRDYGLADAQYTTGGSLSEVITTLQSGQPVPYGVLHSEGTIIELGAGGSARYSQYRVGDRHYKEFDPTSGHWVLVSGFEGAPENPSAFIVNDPDIGGKLRVTPSQLESMGDANASGGGIWMVHQAGR